MNDNKKFVLSYNHNGKDYFWYNNDVEGDSLISNINLASIFTGKQIKSFGLETGFNINDEVFCEDISDYITINTNTIWIEI
jgi:hypothetical protein